MARLTVRMTLYRIDPGPRDRRVIREMADARGVTLLPPRARAVLVNRSRWEFIGRRDAGMIAARTTSTVVNVKFPWLAVAPVVVTRGGRSLVALRQLVIGFDADPRGGYLKHALLPAVNVTGQYYSCLGTYPRDEDVSHVDFFSTPFSSLLNPQASLFVDEYETLATVRECP